MLDQQNRDFPVLRPQTNRFGYKSQSGDLKDQILINILVYCPRKDEAGGSSDDHQ